MLYRASFLEMRLSLIEYWDIFGVYIICLLQFLCSILLVALLEQNVIVTGKVRQEAPQALEVRLWLQNQLLVRCEETEVVIIMLGLLFFGLLRHHLSVGFAELGHVDFFARVPLPMTHLIVVEDEAWLGHEVGTDLLDLIHPDRLLKFEVDRVLLVL